MHDQHGSEMKHNIGLKVINADMHGGKRDSKKREGGDVHAD